MIRYTIVKICFLLLSINLFGQSNPNKIQIRHNYEDLYILYIAPMQCDGFFRHGPIIITDTFEIKAITEALLHNETKQDSILVDPRIQVVLQYKTHNDTVCFRTPYRGMKYKGIKYKYNQAFCSKIIQIIEDSGAEKPVRIEDLIPPPLPPRKK